MAAAPGIRAYLVAGVGGAAVVLAAAVQTVDGAWTGGHVVWLGLAILPQYLVGLFLVRRRPDHPQARRLLLSASCMAVGVAIENVVAAVYGHGAPGDGFWLVNLVYAEVNIVAAVTGTTLIALYPEGVAERPWIRAHRPRTVGFLRRPAAAPAQPSDPGGGPVASDLLGDGAERVGRRGSGAVGRLLAGAGDAYAVAALIGPALLLWRYRRSGAEQRALMRWLLYTLLAAVALLGLAQLGLATGVLSPWAWEVLIGCISVATMLMVAVSIVVGVLRHGLFDIDVVFRRSAVFAVLWLGIGVLYVAVAATPGLALGGDIPVELAVLLTIGVAVAFQPVRRRLESWADRRVFGGGSTTTRSCGRSARPSSRASGSPS